MRTYDVVGVGRAYTDHIVNATQAFLDRWGIPRGAGREFSMNELGQMKRMLSSPVYAPGGIVANTLSGIAALGGKVGFWGKVADDEAGRVFRKDLAARKVDLLSPKTDDICGSATCFVLVTADGDRSFAYNRGCADCLSDSDVFPSSYPKSRFFLLEGLLLTNSPAAFMAMALTRRAKEMGSKVVLTLSDIPSWKLYHERASFLAEKADIIVGSEREVGALTSELGRELSPRQLVVRTKGENGVVAEYEKEAFFVDAMKPSGTFKNNLGAGDQFLAGLLRGLCFGWALEESLHLGAFCASKILEEEGARPSAPKTWAKFPETFSR